MGAKWLYQLRSAPGQQTSTLHLFHRFEALGAKKVCKWSTQTTLWKRHPPTQVAGAPIRMDKTAQDVFIVNFTTDCPNKSYMLIKEGEEDKVMEAGSNWGTIWTIMNNGSSHPLYDQRMVMVVDGWAYRLGDFVMRVGSVVVRQNASGAQGDRSSRQDSFKGAVLEVEYLASADRSDCSFLVNDIVDIYSQPDGPTAIQVSGYKPVSTITPTKGLGGQSSLHWQSRTREHANEHRAQQFVALFQAVARPTSEQGGGGGGGGGVPAQKTGAAPAPGTARP